MYSYSC